MNSKREPQGARRIRAAAKAGVVLAALACGVLYGRWVTEDLPRPLPTTKMLTAPPKGRYVGIGLRVLERPAGVAPRTAALKFDATSIAGIDSSTPNGFFLSEVPPPPHYVGDIVAITLATGGPWWPPTIGYLAGGPDIASVIGVSTSDPTIWTFYFKCHSGPIMEFIIGK